MLEIGISPCPNDTFIFYGIIKEKIDLKNLKFRFIIEDVETLNNLCINGKLAISKISAHAFYYLKKEYDLLNAGGAISEYGPVVVTRNSERIGELSEIRIALPGKLTTASALMWFYWKKFFIDKKYILNFLPFNQTFDMLIKDEVDIGVLIHEGRFIYPSLGFKLIVDLGDFWKKETGTPIPLGCIVSKKDLKIKSVLEELIRNSINYAFENKDEVFKFVRSYAQELDEKVIISHIETYVNNYTFNMTDKGLLSMETLMNKIEQEGVWGLRNL